MSSSDSDSSKGYKSAPTCASGSTIIYAWALDAEKTELPKGFMSNSNYSIFNLDILIFFVDVAFKVGGPTSIKYLVLQVHYANLDKFKGNQFNNSLNRAK